MKFSKEAKIGLAAVITIILLIWGFNFLKGKNILKRTKEFYVVYPQLGGLKESNSVLINGFIVGSVTELKLIHGQERKVLVRILVDNEYDIPVKSVARLASLDFMGTKAIELILSDEKELHKSGDTLISRVGEGIMDKVADFEEDIVLITTELATLLKNLNDVFTDEMKSDLKGTVKNLENTSGNLETMLSDDGKVNSVIYQLDEVLIKLKASVQELPETMDNIQAISDSLKEAEIKLLISNMTRTIDNMNKIILKIEKGQGTAGQLVNNDSLYIQLSNTTQELEYLLKDLREHPKRYVHFSVFGKKDK